MAERIDSIQGVSQVERVQRVSQVTRRTAGQFGALLQQELKAAEPAISFSKHAQNRAAERGIQVDDALMDQLADSVERHRPREPPTSWPSTPPGPSSSTSPTDG